jgi:hypothetical protein
MVDLADSRAGGGEDGDEGPDGVLLLVLISWLSAT